MAKPQHRYTQDSIYSVCKNWSPSVSWLGSNRLFEYWNNCTKLISFIKIKKKLVIISGINLIRNRIDRICIRHSARFFSFWKSFFIHVFFDELIIYKTLLSSFRFWKRLLIHFDKKNCVFTDKNLIIFSNNPTSFFCNL